MKKRIVFCLIFSLCLLFIFSSSCFASSIKGYFMSGSSSHGLEINQVTSNIYSLLRTVGFIVGACVITWMAIAYMTATGNKKALLKERMIYFIIGVIILVGCIGILTLFEKTAKKVVNTLGLETISTTIVV